MKIPVVQGWDFCAPICVALFDGYLSWCQTIEHFDAGSASASGPFAESGWVRCFSPIQLWRFVSPPFPFSVNAWCRSTLSCSKHCWYTCSFLKRDNQEKKTCAIGKCQGCRFMRTLSSREVSLWNHYLFFFVLRYPLQMWGDGRFPKSYFAIRRLHCRASARTYLYKHAPPNKPWTFKDHQTWPYSRI